MFYTIDHGLIPSHCYICGTPVTYSPDAKIINFVCNKSAIESSGESFNHFSYFSGSHGYEAHIDIQVGKFYVKFCIEYDETQITNKDSDVEYLIPEIIDYKLLLSEDSIENFLLLR